MKQSQDVRGWISKPFSEQTLLAALHTALHGPGPDAMPHTEHAEHNTDESARIPLPEVHTPASLI
jgi:hypothetical protein